MNNHGITLMSKNYGSRPNDGSPCDRNFPAALTTVLSKHIPT